MRHLLSSVIVAVVVLTTLAFSSCSSADDPSEVSTGGSGATSTTSTTSATATTSATSSTVASGSDAGTPEDASQLLYGAFVGANRESALTVADPAAVDDLFNSGVDPTGWSLTQCRGSETVTDAAECDFDFVGGSATFLVEGNVEDGYRVTVVGFIP